MKNFKEFQKINEESDKSIPLTQHALIQFAASILQGWRNMDVPMSEKHAAKEVREYFKGKF